MRYKILLKTLKVLIYVKRFFWWLGAKSLFVLAKIFAPLWRLIGLIHYKGDYFFKKLIGAAGLDGQLVKRDNLQLAVFIVLFVVALPQTKLYAKKDVNLPGRQTIAYSLVPADEEFSIEEVTASEGFNFDAQATPFWKAGALSQDQFSGGAVQNIELGGVVAGGSALSKPIILPGQSIGGTRDKIIVYEVQPGDSLGTIAQKFQISIATILWENNLGVTSYLHPADKLGILPVSGLTYTIKKGDTLKKIAALYSVTAENIAKYNKLKADGSDLAAGEKIIIPNGIKQQVRPVVVPSRNINKIATPPGSRQAPSVSGFVWPSSVRTITQYFTWKHSGVDIAGGHTFTNSNYAAKAGVVIKSQCGWNSGYGCVVMIDHGGGIKTLYGHNYRNLVSVGDYVEAGQTIAIMGNTGNVRGPTGIHLHFEVWVNNAKVNPFRFVR
ncbi:MAG: Peptidase M23 [Candidatus Magasanikbacteria bacterium GW2011_GWA2_40_10]|uniref:Peptidase M23 n=1 Tax=Candidatus Magasanikbacteria bacterium GW2011_GWA2_40_10 TaxID=1619037 RepID=A0A0G0QBX2_9BACT|nr:MAG: Peptidase M23 [Candidatus Magasanikbacteria bacterium GW2011_GWA2_40_10]